MSLAAGDGRSPSEGSTGLLLTLGLVGFASAFSMRALDPVVPLVADHFGVSVTQAALIAAAFSIAYAGGQPVMGALGDALGKARLIAISAFCVAIASLLCFAAPTFLSLKLARVLAGLFAGGLIPLCLATIGDRIGLGGRQVAIARFLIAVICGQMSGSAASGILGDLFGWRIVFAVAALFPLLASIVTWRVLRPRGNAPREPLTFSAAAERYRVVFRNPRAKPLLAFVLIEGVVFFGLLPFVAAILKGRSGVGSFEAGIVTACFGIGSLLFGLTVRQLIRRLGPARMVTAGGVLVGCALLAFSFSFPWWTAMPIFILQGYSFYLVHNNLQTQATELAPAARGSAIAVFACALFFGNALGPVVLGFLFPLIGEETALRLFAIAAVALGIAIPRVLPLEGPGYLNEQSP